MTSMDAYDTTGDDVAPDRGSAEPPPVPALVVCWSRERGRIGETLLVTKRSVLGRGAPGDDDPAPRLVPVAQRPGENAPRPPFGSGTLSRVQLHVTPGDKGTITIENVGRRALFDARGRERKEITLGQGDVVEIDRELVLMCRERAARWRKPTRGAEPPAWAFGEADAIGLVGESEPIAALRRDVAFLAKRSAHVLVLGPSGSGKELVAQGIHALSSRRAKKIVSRNAATFPETLVDAELFGNAANYPNQGMPERAGLVGEADGSTLFLDELGELPEALQTRLLRVLDSGEYQRLGDARRRHSSFRFIAATNQPLESLREDVAARVALRLAVPGLNERLEDVPLIARHLLRRIAREDDEVGARFLEAGEPRIGPKLVTALCRRTYTTHVREVEGILWRAIVAAEGDEVELVPALREELERGAAPVAPADVTAEQLREVLLRVGGVRERAWRELGLANRYVLKRLLKKHGLEDLALG